MRILHLTMTGGAPIWVNADKIIYFFATLNGEIPETGIFFSGSPTECYVEETAEQILAQMPACDQ